MKIKLSTDILTEIYSKDRIKRFTELCIGTLLVAISFNLFALPNELVSGGISGLAIITESIFGIPPSTLILIVDLFLVVISYITLGKNQTIHSLIGSILFPIFIELTSGITQYINLENNQLLLSALFAGIVQGFGAGLVYKAGYTLGGTDIINQIISKYAKISMGNAMYFSDGLIILLSGIAFSLNKIMYGIIMIYIIGYITDKVIIGISESKAFYIITKKSKIIKDYILNNLNHTVTTFNATGGYENKKVDVLMTVLPTKEYYKLKEGIQQLDSDALFVVTDAYEVVGGE